MSVSLIERLATRRAGILASCVKCGGLGVVQANGEEVPCPSCRLADLTTHLIGDVTSRFDVSMTRAISPSEIESFILCQRRWGWERLDGIKTDRGSDAAELGKAVHAQLEMWFKAGILPDPNTEAGRIAESGLHLWPAPALVTEIEVHIGCETDASRYHGYQDIGYPDPETGVVVVGDHKTTGNFTWAKTATRYDANGFYNPNNLPDNIQANIYARAAMERHGVEQVKLRWGYLRTKGARKAYPVEVVVTVPEVERVFEEVIDPVAREIHAAEASGKTGIDMEINAKSCDAFGGCPHASRCNLSPTQRLVSIMAQQSLKEKIEAKKALAAASGNAPVVPPVPHINPPESSLPPAPAVVPVAAAPAPEAAAASTPPAGGSAPTSSFAAKLAAKNAAAGGAAPEAPVAPPVAAAAAAPATKKAAAAAKTTAAPPTDALSAARAAKAAADLAYAEAEKTAAAEAEAARLAAIAETARIEAEAKAAAEAAANPPPAPKAVRKTAAAVTPIETTGITKRMMDVCAALEGAGSVEQRRVLAAVSSLLGVGEV